MSMTSRPPEAAAIATSGRGRWIGLALLSIGVAMIIVDATIVNVAVPSIIKDLDLDSTQAEWINTIYALVFAALLITVGRLGDVYGRRRSYLIGLTIFIAASMLAGLAPNGDILILARVLQGVGGAMILPATQAILNANFQGRDRAIAFGIWGSVIGGVAAVGPLLGGSSRRTCRGAGRSSSTCQSGWSPSQALSTISASPRSQMRDLVSISRASP